MTWTAPEVTRQEGPLAGGERPMLQAFLDWQRATLLHKCAGLTGTHLAERAVPPSELSLLGLLRHMTRVERTWFRQRFADEPIDDAYEPEAAWKATDPARAAADYARYTEECRLADAAADNAPLDATFTHNGQTVSLRLIYLHMIEEYARHLGHADLLRERIDGTTGV
ncbi:MAG: DinB family protein [Trebonia sp.]